MGILYKHGYQSVLDSRNLEKLYRDLKQLAFYSAYMAAYRNIYQNIRGQRFDLTQDKKLGS
jgi:hypothetical protein